MKKSILTMIMATLLLVFLSTALAGEIGVETLAGIWMNGPNLEYRLTPRSSNQFMLTMVRAWVSGNQWENVRPDSPWGSMRFYGELSGNQITGTADLLSCNDRIVQISITGEVLDQGRRIVIRSLRPETCYYEGRIMYRKGDPNNYEFTR